MPKPEANRAFEMIVGPDRFCPRTAGEQADLASLKKWHAVPRENWPRAALLALIRVLEEDLGVAEHIANEADLLSAERAACDVSLICEDHR